jgi:hypothetical protein
MGRDSEKHIARGIGGRAQPGSGAPWGYKEDVRLAGVVRVQDKETDVEGRRTRSISVKLDDWESVEEQALLAGETPSMVISWKRAGVKLAIIDYDDWLRFVNMLKEEKDLG